MSSSLKIGTLSSVPRMADPASPVVTPVATGSPLRGGRSPAPVYSPSIRGLTPPRGSRSESFSLASPRQDFSDEEVTGIFQKYVSPNDAKLLPEKLLNISSLKEVVVLSSQMQIHSIIAFFNQLVLKKHPSLKMSLHADPYSGCVLPFASLALNSVVSGRTFTFGVDPDNHSVYRVSLQPFVAKEGEKQARPQANSEGDLSPTSGDLGMELVASLSVENDSDVANRGENAHTHYLAALEEGEREVIEGTRPPERTNVIRNEYARVALQVEEGVPPFVAVAPEAPAAVEVIDESDAQWYFGPSR